MEWEIHRQGSARLVSRARWYPRARTWLRTCRSDAGKVTLMRSMPPKLYETLLGCPCTRNSPKSAGKPAGGAERRARRQRERQRSSNSGGPVRLHGFSPQFRDGWGVLFPSTTKPVGDPRMGRTVGDLELAWRRYRTAVACVGRAKTSQIRSTRTMASFTAQKRSRRVH